ncbi:MAG TPA: hypothetical protein VK530_11780 [Candidatus Acidoferrum sp.]|nr:hypothetical protein [Candidatus Acidoferrum sp.]
MRELAPDVIECRLKRTVTDHLRHRWNIILAWAEGFVSSRFWMVKVTVLGVAFSILCSGGIDFYNLKHGYYGGYYKKIQHPLTDMSKAYEAGTHEAKLNYRLTVPVLLHPLNLSEYQALRWALPIVTIVGVCLLIYFSCLVTFQITGDRVTSLFMTLFVSSTYLGSFGFILCYDAITMAQVILALAPRIPAFVRAALVFSASFTDERGFMAVGLILIGDFCLLEQKGLRSMFTRRSMALLAGMASYWLARLVLVRWSDLPSPIKGVGPGTFVHHIEHWHPGIWFALEGGWLLAGLAVLLVWQERRRLRAFLFIATLIAMFAFCFANGDLVRTTSYALPLAFTTLWAVAGNDHLRITRKYCFFAFFISAIGGNYNVYLNEITWFLPLPVALINQAAFDLYYIFRIYAFGEMP